MSKGYKGALLAVAVTAVFGLGYWLGSAGGDDAVAAHEHTHGADDASAPTIWTCSMDPQVRQDGPGSCPICGMDLIPLEDEEDDGGPRILTMSESAKALARIDTTKVERAVPELEVRMVGKLELDETRVSTLAARFPGRIERLFVNFQGTRVVKGDHLATIYSPELLTAQEELLMAARLDPHSRATQAARQRLRLWGIADAEIDMLLERGTTEETTTLHAPIGGIVTRKAINEGDYVETGTMLFEIADMSQLWLNLDAYESDIGSIRLGQDVTFSVQAYPGREFHGAVAFIEPLLDETTRTIKVRVNVENEQGLLKPGMLAQGVVKPRVGPQGEVYAAQLAGKYISPMHPWIVKDGPGQCDVCGMALVPAEELGYEVEPAGGDEPPVIVPTSAVLRTGKRAVVYVEVPDTEKPTYEGREIVLGPRSSKGFVVLEGLAPGERVVTNGAFKIDSSLQIQAKPSMMAASENGSSSEPATEAIELEMGVAGALVEPYLELQDALASDDLEASRTTLRAMMEVTGHTGPVADLIHTMLAAEDLEGIRRPHFETLSNALITAARENPSALDKPLIQMHCPMVYGATGADWLQATEPLRNPYFGAEMLMCGQVVGVVGNVGKGDAENGSRGESGNRRNGESAIKKQR